MTAIDIAATSLDLGILLGDWRNTNADGGITRIICRESGDPALIEVQCHGRHGDEVKDWGRVSARVYSFTFDSREAGAFNAVFQLGDEDVHLQANVKSGVLVVATFNRVLDRSGRTNYFDREFFHRISR
jgi:hypothetical protein